VSTALHVYFLLSFNQDHAAASIHEPNTHTNSHLAINSPMTPLQTRPMPNKNIDIDSVLCQHKSMKQGSPDKKQIKYILQKAGGEIEVSATLTRKYGKNLSQFALRQWLTRGIPDTYWPDLAQMSGLPLEQIWKACGG
jgi:hypothetical protein